MYQFFLAHTAAFQSIHESSSSSEWLFWITSCSILSSVVLGRFFRGHDRMPAGFLWLSPIAAMFSLFLLNCSYSKFWLSFSRAVFYLCLHLCCFSVILIFLSLEIYQLIYHILLSIHIFLEFFVLLFQRHDCFTCFLNGIFK